MEQASKEVSIGDNYNLTLELIIKS